MTRSKVLLQTGLVLVTLVAGLWLKLPPHFAAGQEADPAHAPLVSVSGHLVDTHGQPVAEASIFVYIDEQEKPASQVVSQEDGTFVVDLPYMATQSLRFEISRAHFTTYTYRVNAETLARLRSGINTRLSDIVLERRVTAGFIFATLCFVGVLLLIAFEVLHNTTATLLGVSLILGFSYLGRAVNTDQFFIFDFARAITYIDFDAIFLVMGMMVVVGILEGTGIFQWLAFTAYRLSRGHMTLLMVILVIITAVASALLDNVTTMLLVAPISLQIALALGIDPLALLIPEVLASNIGGVSTLIGTPANILIGSFADIGFDDFLVNLVAGVILAMMVLVLYVRWFYRAEYHKVSRGISPTLYARLEENARIKDPVALRKGLLVFGVMLFFFLAGDALRLSPVVIALTGATAFLVWVETDIAAMFQAVDWTTLVFFIALFIVVGAIQEVGLVDLVAEWLADVIGDNAILGLIALIWSTAFVSALIDNIPFTAAMLPVAGFLSGALDPANTKVLFYGLSVGAGMGGNGSLIGSAPNMVTAGILERAGFRVSYTRFLRIGLPVMIFTVAAGTIWLLIRFFVMPG